MPLMELHNVQMRGRVGPLTATVPAGEILHLVGPNGAGKSSLLQRMAGLSQGAGSVLFNGYALDTWSGTALSRHRAYLAQHQAPPFAMPVWNYLALHQQVSDKTVLSEDITRTLKLDDKLTRPVNQLSGGEWQRVRLAAVAMQISPINNPDGQLLLLDEPMSSLDVALQVALDRLLTALNAAGITIVMSSHDLNHTLRFADSVWLMQDGQLLASGKTAQVMTPENLSVAYQMPFTRIEAAGRSIIFSDESADCCNFSR